jgi:hypothetical protein
MSTHGEFTVGSVRPSEKFSVNFVALIVPPNFTLCAPREYETSILAPIFRSSRFCAAVPGWSANGSPLGVYVTLSRRT